MKAMLGSWTLAAPIAVGAARVGLGVLWLHEGIFKYSAHFGRADILLVADGAKSNSRVPEYFSWFAEHVLRAWPSVIGILTPLLETLLGVVLVLGVVSLPAAMGSLLTLMTYWSSDQLIAQYPVMGALSVVVIAWPVLATRFSTTALVERALQARSRGGRFESAWWRRWL
jgi:thiosulfate dehydrogenase [quinone] large subunit